jgi:hypothetical protein
MTGADDVRAQALEVAAGWSGPDASGSWQLTAALFGCIARHPALPDRLAELPPDRLPALVASAAISFLVRRDQPVSLARYFPRPGQPQPPIDPAFGPAAATFISGRLDEILAICRRRRYQMNEVARCAQIAAGAAATTAGPVALIDLGTGAGLGLHLDRYRYQIGDWQTGPADAPVILPCELRGSRPVLATTGPARTGLATTGPVPGVPSIAARVGIELHPVDLADPAEVAWLQACAPPEAAALTRLAAATAVARAQPALIVAGDVVDQLPGVLAALPADLPALVVDAYLAVFLPVGRLRALTAILADAGKTRPVTWLSLDPLVPLGPAGRDSVQGLDLPARLVADYQQHGVFAVLGARTFGPAEDERRLLGRAHPSGQWMEWLA